MALVASWLNIYKNTSIDSERQAHAEIANWQFVIQQLLSGGTASGAARKERGRGEGLAWLIKVRSSELKHNKQPFFFSKKRPFITIPSSK